MEIDHHDDSGFHGNTKQCDIAHPDGNAKVVPKPILENEATCHRVKRWKDEHGSFGNRVEHHVKKQEDYEEHDGHDELQSFFSTDFEFVFSGPLISVSSGKA